MTGVEGAGYISHDLTLCCGFAPIDSLADNHRTGLFKEPIRSIRFPLGALHQALGCLPFQQEQPSYRLPLCTIQWLWLWRSQYLADTNLSPLSHQTSQLARAECRTQRQQEWHGNDVQFHREKDLMMWGIGRNTLGQYCHYNLTAIYWVHLNSFALLCVCVCVCVYVCFS